MRAADCEHLRWKRRLPSLYQKPLGNPLAAAWDKKTQIGLFGKKSRGVCNNLHENITLVFTELLTQYQSCFVPYAIHMTTIAPHPVV
jgi:hypothetical protein